MLSSAKKPDAVARACGRVIANAFGLEIGVVARTRAELAAVVRRNPLGEVATNPKRYQVTFLASKLPAETLRRLEAAAVGKEAFAAAGRELYAWHPAGVARSRLWTLLAGKSLGVTATSRNWTTITALLDLAG